MRARASLRAARAPVALAGAAFCAALCTAIAGCESAPGAIVTVDLVSPTLSSPSGIGNGVAKTVAVGAGGIVDIRFTPPGGLVELTIDCSPPEDTDAVGFNFSVETSAFASVRQSAARAGYLVMRDELAPVLTLVELQTSGGSASCQLRVVPARGTCGPREVYRSINVDHDHVTPGAEPRADWETFPSSGDHYPIWAPWDQFYVRPLRTGYLLHDLEHGGLVLTYRCAAPSDTNTCIDAANALLSAKAKFTQTRVNIAPDPTQPLLIGARAWRWAYGTTCYDEAELLDFMKRRFRHGREDIDSDVSPVFDPTQ